MKLNFRYVSLCLSLISLQAHAWEDTKVLPKGVRRLAVRLVSTQVTEKSSSNGELKALASPLQRSLTFKDLLKQESNALKRTLSKGFLDANGLRQDDAVGDFDADLIMNTNIVAPLFAYGLADNFSLGIVVPVYRAEARVQMDFNPSQNGQRLVAALSDSYSNKTEAARDTGMRINNALDGMQQTLEKNGYKPIEDWQATGLGDIIVSAKYRTFESEYISNALQVGVVAPTGRVDDPDNLIDLAFGDGQWDIFGMVVFDQPLAESVTLSEYAKYTEQLPGKKTVRLITEEESIAVEKDSVRFKLGNKLDLGTNIAMNLDSGFLGVAGYQYYRKWNDYYKAGASSDVLARNTDQSSQAGEFALGYSSVSSFRRGLAKVPFDSTLIYKHTWTSRNIPVAQLVQWETNLYF